MLFRSPDTGPPPRTCSPRTTSPPGRSRSRTAVGTCGRAITDLKSASRLRFLLSIHISRKGLSFPGDGSKARHEDDSRRRLGFFYSLVRGFDSRRLHTEKPSNLKRLLGFSLPSFSSCALSVPLRRLCPERLGSGERGDRADEPRSPASRGTGGRSAPSSRWWRAPSAPGWP